MEMKVTIETELKRISKSLSLINDSQTFNKISSTNLENIDDILNDYLEDIKEYYKNKSTL